MSLCASLVSTPPCSHPRQKRGLRWPGGRAPFQPLTKAEPLPLGSFSGNREAGCVLAASGMHPQARVTSQLFPCGWREVNLGRQLRSIGRSVQMGEGHLS